MKLTVATCQFPVSADVTSNARHVRRQIRTASDRGADVAHFCESALTGYPGVDMPSLRGVEWDAVRDHTLGIAALARELGIWVLLGSSHRLSRAGRPHNSVYIIDDRGNFADRYDKMFCAGDVDDPVGEHAHFTPGDHVAVFTIRGVRCGVAICHEYRYPEVYREYKRRGVDVMFHSFHAGNVRPGRLRAMRAQVGAAYHAMNRADTLPGITMPACLVAAAAANHVWISAANSSAPESCFPAFFVRADGVMTGKLRRNRAGVLVSLVDTRAKLYDSTAPWRDRAMNGRMHSGRTVDDPRSKNRREP